jgi:hypothetical protein
VSSCQPFFHFNGRIMPNFTKLTASEIEGYIAYHRPQTGLGSPDYMAALEERENRQGGGLNFGRTFEIVRQAASEGRFVSYSEVAEHSGLPWKAAMRPMPKHLGNLCEYAHRRGWPLLSSIVVNKDNLNTGDLEPQSLSGFIKAAKDLGYVISDEQLFLKEQQHRVFEWGQADPDLQKP